MHLLFPAISCSELRIPTRKCLFHHDDEHPVWCCRAFRAMTLAQRKQIIKLNDAYTHCLEKGHKALLHNSYSV